MCRVTRSSGLSPSHGFRKDNGLVDGKRPRRKKDGGKKDDVEDDEDAAYKPELVPAEMTNEEIERVFREKFVVEQKVGP